MDEKKLIEGINKTGFPLEYKVSKILEAHNWSIITSRYYVDDISAGEREIDIVAYKSMKIDNVIYFTTLIISCKKNQEEYFVFFTKEINKNDPNLQLYPQHFFTNDEQLKFMCEKININKEFSNDIENNTDLSKIYEQEEQILSFQQFDKQKYKPQNDKNIYDSIITSIKACEYEKKSLALRKNTKVFYYFNLLSIVDVEMIKMEFDKKEKISEINEIKYLNRHIIYATDEFYKIQFININVFDNYLTSYDKLAEYIMKYYSDLRNRYYEMIYNNYSFLCLYNEEIKNDGLYIINQTINREFNVHDIVDDVSTINLDNKYMHIAVLFNDCTRFEEKINFLNNNLKVKNEFRKLLNKYYHYDGELKFEDIPF